MKDYFFWINSAVRILCVYIYICLHYSFFVLYVVLILSLDVSLLVYFFNTGTSKKKKHSLRADVRATVSFLLLCCCLPPQGPMEGNDKLLGHLQFRKLVIMLFL